MKLVHFGYRDYDPDVGRFTTKDPIGYAGGDSDLYGYCLDDPVNFYDAKGLADVPWYIPDSVIAGRAREYAKQFGKDLGNYTDDDVIDFIKHVPQDEADQIRNIYESLPDYGTQLTPEQRNDVHNKTDFIRKNVQKHLNDWEDSRRP
jgi:uncharacterized protein RhaS with RHS repeats